MGEPLNGTAAVSRASHRAGTKSGKRVAVMVLCYGKTVAEVLAEMPGPGDYDDQAAWLVGFGESLAKSARVIN